MNSKVNKTNVDTTDELLAVILDVSARIKKREDEFRRTKRHFHTRVAKGIDDDGGIYVYLFTNVTNISFEHSVNTKIKLTGSYISFVGRIAQSI